MISSSEKRWLFTSILFVLLFSSLPNLMGYIAETNNLVYRGIFFDAPDYAVHLSMIRAGMLGDWGYQLRFTTEPHTYAYIRLFYLVVGNINRLLQLPPSVLFAIIRWFFGAFSLYALYQLIARVFSAKWQRKTAFMLAIFGSGVGWLQLIFGWVPGPITPIDFWLIDAYFIFGLAMFPHFSFTTALLCLSVTFYIDFLHDAQWKRIAWIALFAILVQCVNPIAFILADAALVGATITFWFQQQKVLSRTLLALLFLALSQIPLLIYNLHLLMFDPVWSQFTSQNQTLSPPWQYYFFGFAFFWILIFPGIFFGWKKRHVGLGASMAWISVAFALSYAPFAIQRRFLHGITIPFSLLAIQGLRVLFAQYKQQKRKLQLKHIRLTLLLVISLFSISSTTLLLGRGIYLFSHPKEYYYPRALYQASIWLQNNASPNEFILSAPESGQIITQNTDLRVYIGHEMETLYFTSKSIMVENFYRGEGAPNWLLSTPVKWVFYGPYEQEISPEMPSYPWLEKVYQQNDISIYQIVKPSSSP